jgi:hypothetical protein
MDGLSHRDYILSASDTCGFLLNESSTLSLLDANITKPAYTGLAMLNPIYGSAAVCVVSLHLQHLASLGCVYQPCRDSSINRLSTLTMAQ